MVVRDEENGCRFEDQDRVHVTCVLVWLIAVRKGCSEFYSDFTHALALEVIKKNSVLMV